MKTSPCGLCNGFGHLIRAKTPRHTAVISLNDDTFHLLPHFGVETYRVACPECYGRGRVHWKHLPMSMLIAAQEPFELT